MQEKEAFIISQLKAKGLTVRDEQGEPLYVHEPADKTQTLVRRFKNIRETVVMFCPASLLSSRTTAEPEQRRDGRVLQKLPGQQQNTTRRL